MPRVLIVAYGNPMRCDDGLAWSAADQLEEKFSSALVEILRTHQLAPELAETVTHVEAVIFLDAASADAAGNGSPGEVRVAAIDLTTSASRFSHQISPAAIIALAHQLYGGSPRAFSVTLAGECFDHGESLSPAIAAALPALVARVEALVRQILSRDAPTVPDKA